MKPPARRCASLIVAAAMVLAASGCWDRLEVNELGIVVTGAYDGTPSKYEITHEVFRPLSAGSAGQTGGGCIPQGARAAALVSSVGGSPLEAIRDGSLKMGRRLYGAQMVAGIVGESLARENMQVLLNFWEREKELRTTAYFLIAKGKAADVVTHAQMMVDSTLGQRIRGLASSVPRNAYSLVTTFHDVLHGLSSDRQCAAAGVIEIVPSAAPPVPRSSPQGEAEESVPPPLKSGSPEITGLALIKGGKMVAMLPVSHVTRGIVIGLGKVDTMALQVQSQEEPELKITLKVLKVRTEIKAEAKNGISLSMKVTMDADMSADNALVPLSGGEIDRFENWAEAEVVRQMQESIRAVQAIPVDIFGFCEALYRSDAKVWARVKDRWDDIYPALNVRVDAEVSINRTGLTSGPAWKSPH